MRTAARVARSVAPQGGRAYTAAYKQRFDVVSKGARLGKAQTLQVGAWHGANDSQSLAKLWPTKLAPAEARADALFDSVAQKTG
ncbi:hypothetical protein DIPPA_11407 [Diplonema papillatum]|nr:hypothetical protein DIPPA_11407 [Diplonema papillatum]